MVTVSVMVHGEYCGLYISMVRNTLFRFKSGHTYTHTYLSMPTIYIYIFAILFCFLKFYLWKALFNHLIFRLFVLSLYQHLFITNNKLIVNKLFKDKTFQIEKESFDKNYTWYKDKSLSSFSNFPRVF